MARHTRTNPRHRRHRRPHRRGVQQRRGQPVHGRSLHRGRAGGVGGRLVGRLSRRRRRSRPADRRRHRPVRRLPEHHPRPRPRGPRRRRPAQEAPPQRDIQVQPFSSGTPAIEAILSDAIDITYIGPNPAINAFAKSNGEAVRVISGSTSGGAFLVVKPDINSAADLKGKKIATPSLGNTQDVALRAWLKAAGPDHRHRRRRRRLGRAAGQRPDARDVPWPGRSTARGSPSRGRPGSSRRAAARSSSTSATCGRTASTSPPTCWSPRSSSRPTPRS